MVSNFTTVYVNEDSACKLEERYFTYEPVICSLGPYEAGSGAFNFSVFKALLNALHCGDKLMVKSLLKAPPLWGQFSFPGTVCSLLQKSIYINSGLLDTAKFKGKVSLVV